MSLPSPQSFFVKKHEKENRIIDNFCNNITLDKEINHEDIGKLLDLLNRDFEFPKLLIDKVIALQKQNMSLKIYNYENLHHFASILNTITLNIELQETSNEDDVNFAIIYIAERTFYSKLGSSHGKIYLCSIISKNNLYSSKKFWIDLINLKIYKKFENIMKVVNDSNNNTNTSISDNSFNLSNTNAKFLFSNIRNKVMNYFNNSNNNNKISELSENMQRKIERSKCHEVSQIIKEFIPHFSNFNFEISEAIDIIVELASTFSMPKEKISYFISILNSNIFTVKNKSKLEPNKYSNYYNHGFENKINVLTNKNLFEDNLKLVTFGLEFLPFPDYISLLQANKKVNEKVSRKLYKKILLNTPNISIEKRIKVWKTILKCVINY